MYQKSEQILYFKTKERLLKRPMTKMYIEKTVHIILYVCF